MIKKNAKGSTEVRQTRENPVQAFAGYVTIGKFKMFSTSFSQL